MSKQIIKNSNKNIILAVLILVIAASLAGCSWLETADTDQTTKTTTATAQSEQTNPTTTKSAQGGRVVSADQLMQNGDARKAIALAFDKAHITENIISNGSKPVDYFVPQGLAVSADGVDFRAAYSDGWNHFDTELAKDHWQKAKRALNFDTAKIRLLTFDSDTAKAISEYIKSQLEENLTGLEVVLIQQPFSNKIALADKGKFDIEYTGWGPDYPDAMTFLDMFVTGAAYNVAGYTNQEYDNAIKRAKVGILANDFTARTKLLQSAEKLLVADDCIVVPLYQRAYASLLSPKVKGIVFHRFGGSYTYDQATTKNITDGKKIIRLFGGSDIPTMDTNRATDSVSLEIMANVLEGLTKLDENDMPVAAGASSWQVSEDGTEYTFHLVENAQWSNGAPVTAEDYVYSWRRLADSTTKSSYQLLIETAKIANYEAVINGEAPLDDLGVSAIDPYTLKVKLETPVPYFLKLMSFPSFFPVNQQFAEAKGEAFGTSLENTLYNGAYTISHWQVGYSYALAKNENYWNRQTVLNDGVNFRIVKDAIAGINLYELGEVDRAEVSGELVNQYIDHPHFVVEDGTAVFYLVFNVGNHNLESGK